MSSTVYKFGVRLEGDATDLAKAARTGETALKGLGKQALEEAQRVAKIVQGAQQATKAGEAALKGMGQQARQQSTLAAAAAKDAQSAARVAGVAFNEMAQQAGSAARRAEQLAQQAMRREAEMARARRTLGVRAEREVRAEIERTISAYQVLARSGTLSWREQRVAARAMREEVTRLTHEMGRLTTREKLAAGAKGVAAAGAGLGVAAAVMAPKVQRALDYDTRIAYLANTAYGDQSDANWRAGLAQINAMVVDAVRNGGGTRDGAASTAEALFGAGVFDPKAIGTILREAVRAGTANNADPAAFAQMAITASQTFGVRPERMGALFGMGTYAGQKGGFEIKDMAKWLPQQMAAARAVGMSGEAGFAKLAAVNQAAVVTAGTRDEAGNNVVNLLAKIGSQDTAKDFKKIGIDLPKELAQGRMKGLDALDVVGGLLQQQLAKDRNYRRVQKELNEAKGDDARRAALESVGNIAQGTVIGRVFQDRQALMALYGFMQGRDRVAEIARGATSNTGASDSNFNRISSLPGYKVAQAKNEAEIATQASLERLAPAIGGLADRVGNLMREYPGYTTAVGAATTALVSLAGSAAALALIQGRMAGVGLGGAAAAAGGMALRGGLVGVAGAAGYGAGTLVYKGLLEDNAAGNLLGRGVARTLSFFGNKDAEQALRSEAALGADNMPAPGSAAAMRATSRMPAGGAPLTFTSKAAGGTASRTSAAAAVPSIVRKQDTAAALTVSDRLAPAATAPKPLSERLGSGAGAAQMPLPQELKGEILVRVSGAPGLNVQAETRSSTPGVPFRANVGRSNLNTGF